jgi:integrase
MPRGLTGVEMSHLLAAIPDSPSGVRDRAVVLLAVFTGLRRGEILGLLGSDIASVEPFVIRPIVKGARVRILTVPAPAATAIRRYLESEGRTLATLGREERLFRISPSGYAANLQRYAKNAGLAHVSPHMLRHTAAKLRWQAGSSMDEVSMILGHADLATTARYLKAVNPQTDRGWAAVMKQLGGAAGDPPAALAIARLEQRCNKRDRKRVYRTRRRTFVATPGLPNER